MSNMNTRGTVRLFWLTLALFLSYLSVALPLPVLPLYVTDHFAMPNWMGGLVVGIAFLSTLFSRKHAGSLCDAKGGKNGMRQGLFIYAAASAICLLSVLSFLPAAVSYSALIGGRLLLGVGESLVLVGMISWNIGLSGPQYSGRVMSMVGIAMYGAFAAGGPAGLALYQYGGFSLLMIVCISLPLLGYGMIYFFPDVTPPPAQEKTPFLRVIRHIWKYGAVVGLEGVAFAALGAFISLHFFSKGWDYASLGLTFFGSGFVMVRLLCWRLPDKIGGIKVAGISILIGATGQYLLWLADHPLFALAGALLTGIGCSMIFPAMGVEVVHKVPPALRATALGGFSAFQDISYCLTGPIAGLLADGFGYPVVFLFGGLSATLGLVVLFPLWQKSSQRITVTH